MTGAGFGQISRSSTIRGREVCAVSKLLRESRSEDCYIAFNSSRGAIPAEVLPIETNRTAAVTSLTLVPTSSGHSRWE